MTQLTNPWKHFSIRRHWILVLGAGVLIFGVNVLCLTWPYVAKDDLLKSIHRHEFQTLNSNIIDDRLLKLPSFLSGTTLTAATTKGREVRHIAFLKVHKAASSTAQNIFLRFGWRRNLTFVLAPAKNPSGFPNIISVRESLTNSNILPPPPDKHYDIMCNHVLYSNEAFAKFMPSDSVFIGILREPFELYKSILNYFRPHYIFNKINLRNPASEFLRDPTKYEPKGKLTASWTNNRMAIEFGFPETVFTTYNESIVDAYLKKLDKEFQVILISEHMEESVIIMRRYLNWETQDILFLSKNIARHKNETMLTQSFDREFYKRYAKIDYTLYNYFYKRLREQIRREGADFDDELIQFKDLRKTVEEYCYQSIVSVPMSVLETRWGNRFNITRGICEDMKRGEIPFITKIREWQYGSKDI